MSYIEREPLLEKVKSIEKQQSKGDGYLPNGAVLECKMEIVFAPSVDVVEVRHGEWKHNSNGGYVCSECNCWLEDYYGAKPKMMNYCFQCGAKMDGERREE